MTPVYRLLFRLLPGDWRARYGDELRLLLTESDRPIRDAGDVLALVFSFHLDTPASLLRKEALMHASLLKVLACALIGVGALGVAMSTTQLAGGVREIPAHWWSTLASMPIIGGAVIGALAWRLLPRPAR